MSRYRFIAAEKAEHQVSTLCRTLGVSRSGFYSWATRPSSARRQKDNDLLERLRRVHQMSRGTYDAARIHAELAADGHRHGRKRIARLMRLAGLEGAHRRRFRRTTERDPLRASAADLVERRFAAERPNALWVADITYVRTWAVDPGRLVHHSDRDRSTRALLAGGPCARRASPSRWDRVATPTTTRWPNRSCRR